MSLENEIVDKALNSWEQVIPLHFEIGSYMATDLKSGSALQKVAKSWRKCQKVAKMVKNNSPHYTYKTKLSIRHWIPGNRSSISIPLINWVQILNASENRSIFKSKSADAWCLWIIYGSTGYRVSKQFLIQWYFVTKIGYQNCSGLLWEKNVLVI